MHAIISHFYSERNWYNRLRRWFDFKMTPHRRIVAFTIGFHFPSVIIFMFYIHTDYLHAL